MAVCVINDADCWRYYFTKFDVMSGVYFVCNASGIRYYIFHHNNCSTFY